MTINDDNHSKSAIIFDFDGTLADSFALALTLLYELTRHAPLPEEDVSRLRGLSPVYLLRELKIPFWSMPFLAWRARTAMSARLASVELIPGMREAVIELSKTHQLFVLSSNSVANVRNVLQRVELDRYFKGIYGGARPLAKAWSLRRLLRRSQLLPSAVWYVGDETSDIDAAHRVGLKAMAVSWGFNNISVLTAQRPEAMVFTPDELVVRLREDMA